jgi:hypothetical protein
MMKLEASSGVKGMLHNANTASVRVADGMKLSIFDRIEVPQPEVGLEELPAAAE